MGMPIWPAWRANSAASRARARPCVGPSSSSTDRQVVDEHIGAGLLEAGDDVGGHAGRLGDDLGEALYQGGGAVPNADDRNSNFAHSSILCADARSSTPSTEGLCRTLLQDWC